LLFGSTFEVVGRFHLKAPLFASRPCKHHKQNKGDIIMDDYETRKQKRIDRLYGQAGKAREESASQRAKSDSITDNIPFGQPILVGHHSEKADRARRERAFDQWGKSVKAAEKAEYYEQRAEAAENNTAISGDDPQALVKLEERLTSRQEAQKHMKSVNAYFRKHGSCRGYPGMDDRQAATLDVKVERAYSWDKQPFPSYQLTNNNADIRRLKERIKTLAHDREVGFVGWEFEGGHAEVNCDLNRLQLLFDGKPNEQTRAALKRSGFKWAPSEGAWQRQLTANAVSAAGRLDFLTPTDGRAVRDIQPRQSPKDIQVR
jgi:hypothetical protein